MTYSSDTHPEKLLSRRSFIQILNAALASKSYRFARQSALSWLAVFPGDLQVNLGLAKALLEDGKANEAAALAHKLTQFDPVFLGAHIVLADAIRQSDPEAYASTEGCIFVLGGKVENTNGLPDWSYLLHSGWQAASKEHFDEAEKLIHQAMALNSEQVLGAVYHLMLNYTKKDKTTVYRLASLYHQHWPDCIQFSLCMAEANAEMGDDTSAVNLLHQCVTNDLAGQVARRVWGKDHRYQPLWPDPLEVHFDLPIPAEVAARLGLNQLSPGEIIIEPATQVEAEVQTTPTRVPVKEAVALVAVVSANILSDTDSTRPGVASSIGNGDGKKPIKKPLPDVDQTVQKVEEALEKFAKSINKPGFGRADGRFPIFVIFTSRTALEKKYGQQTAVVVTKELDRLVSATRKRSGWGALAFYPDDPANTALLGLPKSEPSDAWKLKLSLSDLDKTLARKGERIGALLIIGGPDVVPFHRLPNPTDDGDTEILSDNPYATFDSNYFIPEWPVGRLPGEAGSDAGLLLEQIRNLIKYHTKFNTTDNWWRRIFSSFNAIRHVQKVFHPGAWFGKTISFGYTASVWKQSSWAVFRQVGDSRSLLASPPMISGSLRPERLTCSNLGYYNLHGLEDSENWYGQKDLSDRNPGPDYPVALCPKDLVKNGSAPQIVFSEACYGGNILDKKEDKSLVLKFKGIGTLAVVASTCISYGSVTTPLIGADLLGYLFWKKLGEGLTVGEAFLQAKIGLVQEMNKRQGYLDGEDQKTLISFVLYGDPLVGSDAFFTQSKGMLRMRPVEMKMMCDRQEEGSEPQRIPSEVIREVKQAVEHYLPGLGEAEIHVSRAHEVSLGKYPQDLNDEPVAKNQLTGKKGSLMVTISKKVEVAQHIHQHYIKVTLDAKGKVMKMAVSR